jgi:hypothetical protein
MKRGANHGDLLEASVSQIGAGVITPLIEAKERVVWKIIRVLKTKGSERGSLMLKQGRD